MNLFHADTLVVSVEWAYKCFTVVSIINYFTQNSLSAILSIMRTVKMLPDFYQPIKSTKFSTTGTLKLWLSIFSLF